MIAFSGEEHGEGAALVGQGGDFDVAALLGDDLAGEVETDADTVLVFDLLTAIEAAKDLAAFAFGDTGALVGDVDAAEEFVGLGSDGDSGPSGRIFDGVVADIVKRFCTPAQVAAESA